MALQIFNIIEQIEQYLENQDKQLLIDYRVILKISTEIEVTLLVSKTGILEKSFLEKFSKYESRFIVNEITEDDKNENGYYRWAFSEQNLNKIDYGLRLRLNNLIDFVKQEERPKSKTPVLTFYSYKGGMGRSTTLACFASYLAKKENKKVVVVDCDFEAPGFTNYYDLSTELLSQRSGVVEYLLDKRFLSDSNEKLSLKDDYCYEVGYEYVGNGQIYIIPAGNLWEDSNEESTSKFSNRRQYLEALARLDLSSVDIIVEEFEAFIRDIEEQLQPDIILFDSRTGFNDVFATLATVSNIIVGFFGINQQNIVGLEQFLTTFGNNTTDKKIFVVNSIISSVEYYDTFEKIVTDYLEEETVIFEERLIKTYSVQRNLELEKVGTPHAYKRKGQGQSYDANFVDIIDKNIIFQPLFGDISQAISQISVRELKNEEESVELNISESQYKKIETGKLDFSDEELIEFLSKKENYLSSEDFIALRKVFIEKLHKDIPESSHAEDAPPTVENFYYRECMKDMFNRDKFLIRGSKGTGKTFLYQAFENPEIRQKIITKANITDNYDFINLISLNNDVDGKKYFDTTKFDIRDNENGNNYFFERFWVIYVWNSIMLKLKENSSELYVSLLEVEAIENTPIQATKFKGIINDEVRYNAIFEDLKNLDTKLQESDENLIILFEQLDYIVQPTNWGKGISPLINFWRSNPFKRILPKIFIRTDLMDRLTGTNSPNWANRSIDIEWTKKEIFSYFFKLVLQNQKNDFFRLIYHCAENKNIEFLDDLLNVVEDNEIPTEERYLRPLVELFFGRYANWTDTNIDSGMGESYDWFEKNLKDGNDRISLRPLIDMLRLATQKFIEDRRFQKFSNSILPASYYADGTVREECVKVHFDGLAKEVGNEPLQEFYKYITTEGDLKFKIPIFKRELFLLMLNNIFTKYKKNESMERITKPDDLKELLINNGIIKETDNTNRAYTNYVIPFLYRYYFRVSNKNNLRN